MDLEDVEAARRLRGPLLEYSGLNLVAGQFVAVFGSTDRYLGAVDSLLGTGTPEEWFAAAAEMDRRMSAPVHEALTLTEHARHLHRLQASPQRVKQLVKQARSLAEPIGHERALRQVGRTGRGNARTRTRAEDAADCSGDGSGPPRERGPEQPRDRPSTRHHREHSREPCAQHSRQDGVRKPDSGCHVRGRSRTAALTDQRATDDPSALIVSVTSTITSAGSPARSAARRIASDDGAS